jgi:hypothetical protein
MFSIHSKFFSFHLNAAPISIHLILNDEVKLSHMANQREPTRMGPLPRGSFPDAAMNFKGEDFEVDWYRFVQNSAKFRHQPFPACGISITSDVSREEVVEFEPAIRCFERYRARSCGSEY